jgi:hypothetical protein
MTVRWLPLLLCAGCTEYDFHNDKSTEPPGDDGLPVISVAPGAVDLGIVQADETGEEVVTIANIGTGDLVLSALTLASGASWSITAGGIETLAPDEATTAVLTWEALESVSGEDALSVASNDPETPVVDVPLSWLLETEEAPLGVLSISPSSHDFGTIEAGRIETARFTVENIGDGPLTVTDLQFSATSSELALEPLSVPLPWNLAPGDTQGVGVSYAPVDDIPDEGAVLASSDVGDQQADVTGNGRLFDGFSTGWYVWDPRNPISTVTDPDHVVDHHGDEDSYFYENSGMHGMTGSVDLAADFAVLRDYVITNAGAPIIPTGPFDWDESSTVSQFNEATFTYFLCDFYLPITADPGAYTIETGPVDDGVRVLVNGHILGHQKLSDAQGQWTLEHATPGAVNTLLVILVDDAAVYKYLVGLGFWHEGALVEG